MVDLEKLPGGAFEVCPISWLRIYGSVDAHCLRCHRSPRRAINRRSIPMQRGRLSSFYIRMHDAHEDVKHVHDVRYRFQFIISNPLIFLSDAAPNSLSAYLYEATQDKQYLDAAQLSANFVRNNMYNSGDLSEYMDASKCTIGTRRYTWDAGSFLEGVSVLANITSGSAWMAGLSVFLRFWSAALVALEGDLLILRESDRLRELVVGRTTNAVFNTADGRISECKHLRVLSSEPRPDST